MHWPLLLSLAWDVFHARAFLCILSPLRVLYLANTYDLTIVAHVGTNYHSCSQVNIDVIHDPKHCVASYDLKYKQDPRMFNTPSPVYLKHRPYLISRCIACLNHEWQADRR